MEQMQHRENVRFFGGVMFTLVLALAGFLLARIPGLSAVGPLTIAIVLAIVYRSFLGYPQKIKAGVVFSSKKVLRFAIVLYGFQLNLNVIWQDGLGVLLSGAVIIVLAIGVMLLIGKWFKADRSLSMLLGVGTGICGASAIAAVSPIIRAKDEDTAIGVGLIALVGTVFALIFTALSPVLPLSPVQYGEWTGLTIHEVAQVVLAGAAGGEDGLAMALLAKLGRVFLLIPVCFILMALVSRKNEGRNVRAPFPWFLIGFVAMSALGTYVLGPVVPVTEQTMEFVSTSASFLLTMAMAGLGLNVDIRQLGQKAWRPLLTLIVTSVIVSVAGYVLVVAF
ncbi:YeiH family protein [Bacillaceae bacterium SIJ1]|uniref:YeiH family protein n=1 Tax=Litoribacterium kuwaitense TaxID=1398745 RepID=UPI0013EDA7A7|nr:YeiH family protein [Litoribacterium kuwaitense]NGP46680.1 YeiH family protein [Litoribacterium kuwaitense]